MRKDNQEFWIFHESEKLKNFYKSPDFPQLGWFLEMNFSRFSLEKKCYNTPVLHKIKKVHYS